MNEMNELRCLACDTIFMSDHSDTYCLRHYAEYELIRITGLSISDLPDGLPLEDFVDGDGNLDFDGIGAW